MDREVLRLKSATKLNRRQAVRIGLVAMVAGFSARVSSADERTNLASTIKRIAKPESALRQRADPRLPAKRASVWGESVDADRSPTPFRSLRFTVGL